MSAIRFVTSLLLLLFAVGTAVADGDDTVLTVEIDGVETDLTITDLEKMPVSSFETSTIWTEGKQTFVGVRLSDFLAAMEISEGSLKATAVNDYSVDVPVSDAVAEGPMIAYLRNGDAMTLREKGPLWLVYPYDLDISYQSEVIYSRSIWQLRRIEHVGN